MMQHVYKTQHFGDAITVRAGWDYPLQQFFLVIEQDESPEDDEMEGRIYSNLDDDQAAGCRDWAYFEKKLKELAIAVPDSFNTVVRMDGRNNCNVSGELTHVDDK
jgi:hypothetical protein